MIRAGYVLIVAGFVAGPAVAQGVRDHTRPEAAGDTTISESQAIELTLTVIESSQRSLQTWVRMAGTPDASGRVLVGDVFPPEADLVQVGQRVRVFPPESKSRMNQAKVSGVTKLGDRARIEVTIPVEPSYAAAHYVMEIVVERGRFLAVSNEAIIQEGGQQIVYVEEHPGHYMPREIRTGLTGELYAEVLDGLETGERVVTFGSFFIDAEHKLKNSEQNAISNAHLHH